MRIWYPDFCVSSPGCAIEIEPDWISPRRFVRLCPHHQSLRDSGVRDAQLFVAIVQSSRVKERARAALKQHLALPADHPGVDYTVDSAGNISIASGRAGAARTAAQAAVTAALVGVSRPTGTSTVTVL